MRTTLKFAVAAFGLILAGEALAAPRCVNTGSFEQWLDAFKKDALAQGISARVIAEASPDMKYDPVIIRRDGGQAVFQQTFIQFSDRMTGGGRIPNGQAIIKKNAALFAKVEKQYGVPAPVLAAFWGLESDFGASFGKYRIITANTTLAYDCRRPDFFRNQLLDTLRIVERSDQPVEDMNGDWAGEFGGMQFTASDYLKNAVDFDGDGRRDLIKSIPDTVASAANFLVSLGWQRGQPWLQEVLVQHDMPWDQADLTIQHPVSQWAKWGVRPAYGQLAAADLPASMILPMGRNGPAFLVYPNFKAFLGWNSAYVYSTTVAYYATRIAGAPPLNRTSAATIVPLTSQQMMAMQQAMMKQNYDGITEADGKFGAGTRAAVKKAQMKYGLPADSYPTVELLAKLGVRAAATEPVATQPFAPVARAVRKR